MVLKELYLGVQACQIHCNRFWGSAISGSWNITDFQAQFLHLGGCDWEKCFKELLECVYLGFKACRIQWKLGFSMISGSWKNLNFKVTHSRKWGSKPGKWDGTYVVVLLGSHFTPTPCYRTLYLDLPIKMQRNHNNSKNLWGNVWHSALQLAYPKPICADLQALANTFSLCKLMFIHFLAQLKMLYQLVWCSSHSRCSSCSWHGKLFQFWCEHTVSTPHYNRLDQKNI